MQNNWHEDSSLLAVDGQSGGLLVECPFPITQVCIRGLSYMSSYSKDPSDRTGVATDFEKATLDSEAPVLGLDHICVNVSQGAVSAAFLNNLT